MAEPLSIRRTPTGLYLRLTELTSEDDVLHKLRNVVPSKLRNSVRDLLLDTHINAVQMEGNKKAKTRKQNFRPGLELNVDTLPCQVSQLQRPEALNVPALQASQVFQVRLPQERQAEVVIPKRAAKEPEPAPQQMLRDRGALKPAVRFEDEFDGLGSKRSTKKT